MFNDVVIILGLFLSYLCIALYHLIAYEDWIRHNILSKETIWGPCITIISLKYESVMHHSL